MRREQLRGARANLDAGPVGPRIANFGLWGR
jgi:hypothetical protein